MKKKALFLDRDGVINFDTNYVHRMEDFKFIPGVFRALKMAQDLDYTLIVITNQAGIGRGYYSERDFFTLDQWMKSQFQIRGINIAHTYYCPHHPVYGLGYYRQDCECRKPKPGMLLQAERDFDLDMGESIFVGDNESDIEAGFHAGVGKLLLFDGTSGGKHSRCVVTQNWHSFIQFLEQTI